MHDDLAFSFPFSSFASHVDKNFAARIGLWAFYPFFV